MGSGDRDLQYGPISKYCEDLYSVTRRKTRTVRCGPINFGSEHAIVRQTMATTNTADVDATIEQVMRCADKGFDLVRVTVQGKREANACMKIREGLFKKGYTIPLCADMHFQPVVALMVADAVEKIRINPGNFADGRKDFEEKIYETEEDYFSERAYLVEALEPLVQKCKELDRCMRIGTNHGSLSSRVLSFYGDTPRGMVESALEFADICRSLDYHNFVFSMKASNPLVMVQSYRLLAAEQYRLGWDYDIDKNNTLTSSFRFGLRNQNSYQDKLLNKQFLNGSLVNTNTRNVNVIDNSGSFDANIDYTHTYATPQREFSILTQVGRNNRQNDFINAILDGNSPSFNVLNRIKNDNISTNTEATIQTDYQTPLSKNQLIEFGAKGIFRQVSSDFKYYYLRLDFPLAI